MTCHLCGTPLADAPVVGTSSRGGRPSRRVACVRCGLVQVSPQPSAEDLHAYYTSGDYHREHGPVPMCVMHPDGRREVVRPEEPGYAAAIEIMHTSRARAVVDALRLAPGSRVLEVGCSDGRTLAAIQALGMSVQGVEPDAAMADAAFALLGDGVWPGTLDDIPDDWRYDAIVAFHVLEHVPDPLSWLAKVRARLRPGGQLFVEVPDTMRPDADLDGYHWQWVHLYDFTQHTLMELLARAGFDDITTDDRGTSLRAWARETGAEPRAWVSSGGPDGQHMARALDAHRARAVQSEPVEEPEAPTGSTVLGRFMAGEGIDVLADAVVAGDLALVRAAEHQMRVDFKQYVEAVHRIAHAYRDLVQTIGELGAEMQRDAEERLEGWHPDPYVHGHAIGEGAARRTCGALMVHVANAGKMLEITDGERG